MIDVNDLARRCQSSMNDPQARAAMEQAMRQLKGGAGKQFAQNITPDTAKRIERAAQAAGSGDKAGAMQALSDILGTPEGAALAKQLQFLMGK